MSEPEDLFASKWFKYALYTPILLATLIVYYIDSITVLIYNPSVDGINQALIIFKIPLMVLAMIFPAVALVASQNRSIQTNKQINTALDQIKETEQQNSFSNHFKHLEEFTKYIEKGDRLNNHITDIHVLHRHIFCVNNVFSISPVQSVTDSIKINAIKIYKNLRILNESPADNPKVPVCEAFLALRNIEHKINLPPITHKTPKNIDHKGNILNVPLSIREVFESINCQIININYIMMFLGNNVDTPAFSALLNMKYGDVTQSAVDYVGEGYEIKGGLGAVLHDCGESGEVIVLCPSTTHNGTIKIQEQ